VLVSSLHDGLPREIVHALSLTALEMPFLPAARSARGGSLMFLAAPTTFKRTRLLDLALRSQNKPARTYLSLMCPCSPMANLYRRNNQACVRCLRRSYKDANMSVNGEMASLPLGFPQAVVVTQPDLPLNASCSAIPLMKCRHQHHTCSPCRRVKCILPYQAPLTQCR